MTRNRMLSVAALGLGALALLGADWATVPGSTARFQTSVEVAGSGKAARLNLTGAALRQKFLFNVYAVGSYLQEGAAVRNAEELAAADLPKRLHLIMERTVEGKDMAEAFRAAIRLNYPEPAFVQEVAALTEWLRGFTANKGDHVLLTHVPGVGLHCAVAGRAEFTIRNVRFSRAVWDIYLGKNNLGEGIKRGLTSRL